ncbi:hypothetical protein, partial [Clostridium perfringens]|uniref:hypothetical protein n=1 Tax=Clostridium perfringens TaxID=1502 RepID=UPI0019CFBC2A
NVVTSAEISATAFQPTNVTPIIVKVIEPPFISTNSVYYKVERFDICIPPIIIFLKYYYIKDFFLHMCT